MRKSGTIVSYTAEEIVEMIARGEDRTNWARIDAMTEEELEASIDWEEEGVFDDDAPGFPGAPGTLRETTLLLDDQVIQWFRLQGPDYLERIYDVLLEYVIAQQEQPGKHRHR
jgi:uncharacterized protein (DUF4415 family)